METIAIIAALAQIGAGFFVAWRGYCIMKESGGMLENHLGFVIMLLGALMVFTA